MKSSAITHPDSPKRSLLRFPIRSAIDIFLCLGSSLRSQKSTGTKPMDKHRSVSSGRAGLPVQRRPLSSLEPIDTAPFRRPSGWLFIWLTILLVWLISLLPWRLWQPAPDLLLLVILFWCVNEPRRIGLTTAF